MIKKILFILFLFPVFGIAQHTISGTFKPAKEFSYVFLYKSTPEKTEFVESKKLDSNGAFSMKLDSTITAGIYKVIYGVPVEENNFEVIYNTKESIDFTFFKDSTITYNESNENKLLRSYMKSMDLVNQTISNFYLQEKKSKSGFESIFKTLKETQEAYEASAKGSIAEKFIIANRPYIPDSYENVGTYSKKLKANYLKHINYNDDILKSSTFLKERVTNYVFEMVEMPTDNIYIKLVDELVSSFGNAESKIKEDLLSIIWKKFVDQNNDVVSSYMAETYLLELTQQTKNKKLEVIVKGHLNTAIGKKAPDFEINVSDDLMNLHDLKTHKNYLVIFWSSTCGHCLNELPQVHEKLKIFPDVKVIAYGLESDTVTWSEEKEKLPDFIHTIGLGKWNNEMAEAYGIRGTPSYFLLNENLEIIAKPYSMVEALKAIKSLK